MENEKLHYCSEHDLDVKWNDYKVLYGAAVIDCKEHDDGHLYVDNSEYGNRVNYCPFCGFKAKKQMKMKPK